MSSPADTVRNLGAPAAAFYLLQKLLVKRLKRGRQVILYSKHSRYRLFCRANTSDIDVFSQIFVHREYRCLDNVKDAQLIIDCGANVGYSAVYFLTWFPNAHVIAVEPDPDNFKMLLKNTAAYGSRVTAICSGVWSEEIGLVMNDERFGDDREWARTVRPAREGEAATFFAKDIGILLQQSGFDHISILKIDIEGSESEVFRTNYKSWLGKVDNLVIELHDEECADNFKKAVSGENFEINECDELTVCLRSHPTRTYS
jgi:FkbM family methyltransferase